MAKAAGLGGYKELPTLDPGWYTVEIDKAEVVPTKDGSNVLLKVEAHTIDGPDQNSGDDPLNRKLFAQFPHPDPSHKDGGTMAGVNLQKFLDAADVEYTSDGEYDENDLVGKEVDFKVRIRTYEGEPQEDVRKTRPAGGESSE
jgi:hypothetical protein